MNVMRILLAILIVGISSCVNPDTTKETFNPSARVETTLIAGRILNNGRQLYGEVLARRSVDENLIHTAVIYNGNKQIDPITGRSVSAIVSGIEVDCVSIRIRYTYHEGLGYNGSTLYRVEFLGGPVWNTGLRINREVASICEEPRADDELDFSTLEDFLNQAAAYNERN